MDKPGLTEEERQTLNWLSQGKRAEDIAQIMAVRVRVVYWRMECAQQKLICNTICGAVAKALRTGIIR